MAFRQESRKTKIGGNGRPIAFSGDFQITSVELEIKSYELGTKQVNRAGRYNCPSDRRPPRTRVARSGTEEPDRSVECRWSHRPFQCGHQGGAALHVGT